MAKICLVEDCNNYVFAKKYCKRHQYLRMDKSTKKDLSSIVAPVIKRQTYNYKGRVTGENILFKAIWETRPHISFLSGKKIFEPRAENFAHVLAKGKYPEYRLLDKNIILLTREEHFLFDQGTIAKREQYAIDNKCDWNKIETLKQEILNNI